MSRNIKYQIFNAIESSFELKMDKHSAKAEQGLGSHKIYSYADRNNLKDFGANLANWLKAEYPKIKAIKDVTQPIVQEFIDNKAKSVSKATVDQYISKLSKLEKIINHRYRTANVDFQVIKPETKNKDKIRDVAFAREDFDKVMYFYEQTRSKSEAVLALSLAGRFSLRVSETTKLMPKDLRGNKLHINKSKGARSRELPLSQEDIDYLYEKFKGFSDNEYVVKIKPDSVNKSLSRTLEKLGINRYKKAKSGIHAIRKMKAQELYDVARLSMSKEEAMDATAYYLGHRNNRKELIEQYVLNLH